MTEAEFIDAAVKDQAARAMLTALLHAQTILMTSRRNAASENLVWIEIGDAIAAAKAAGIKAEG